MTLSPIRGIRIKLRRGTAAEWAAMDTVLDAGEPGLDMTSWRVKFGDGVTPWSGIPFPPGAPVYWLAIIDKPSTFPPSAHTHSESDITGLVADLAGKAAVSHVHVISDITGLTAVLLGKSDVGHTHAQADITGLVAALAGKSDVGHTHAWADITGKPTTFPPSTHSHVISDVTGLQAALDALRAIALSTPTRAIGTAFQPHATKNTLVSYSVRTQATNPLLAGNSRAQVRLLSDASNPPTTERCRVAADSAVGLAVAIQITTGNEATLQYLVPAGHYVLLSQTTTGTGAASIVAQVEEVLG